MPKLNYAFASDNASPAHPRVIQAIVDANSGYQPPYDNDEYGNLARKAFKKIFGPEACVFFVFNGTGANVSILLSILNNYQAVLCSADAHINTDECGAAERIVGSKLIVAPSTQAKIHIAELDQFLSHQGDLHRTQIRILSITQATEFGTLYSKTEIKALCDWAHQHNILVHVDGARLANAVVSLGGDFRQNTFDLGVDMISFGATKNGLAFGEAVLFKNATLAEPFLFARKQCTQLLSKSRYISAQFIPYLEENIWRTNAEQANHCAQKIARGLAEIDIMPLYPVQANEIFIELDAKHLEQIQKTFFLYPWTELPNNKVITRIVTSWASVEEEVEQLLQCIKQR